MSLPVGGEFTFHYGHKSLAAHRQQAARLGIGAALVDRPGLAADLDTVDDLAMLDDSFVRLGPDLRRAIARARGGIDA